MLIASAIAQAARRKRSETPNDLMRTIKSVWTKPKGFFFPGLEELTSLSILRTVRYTGGCEIFADSLGAEWIRRLRLPVTKIAETLEKCPGDGAVWNEGKLYCNLTQETPFIQTDLDVIQGRAWPKRLEGAAIIAERAYNLDHVWLRSRPLEVPEHWAQASGLMDGRSFACGTYGGSDLAAIQEIAETGLQFIARNRNKFAGLDPYLPVVVAEEWAVVRGFDWMEVTTLLPSLPDGAVFAAKSKAYMHLIGPSKRRPDTVEDIRRRLREEAPERQSICAEVRKWIETLGR